MNRNRKLKIIIIVVLAIYSLAGFIIIPLAVKSILPKKLGEILNREVFLKDVHLNPYTLTLSLEGLEVKEKDSSKDFVSFSRLMVNAQVTSLFRMGLLIKEIKLEKPFVSIVRVSDTAFNFSDLIEKKDDEVKTATEPQPSKPFQFELSDIQIVDGRIDVWDAVIKKSHNIKEISFNVPFISNFKKHRETQTKPGLKVQLNDTLITADLTTKPFADSLETILDINLSGIRLPHYFDYVPKDLGFKITNGTMDIQSKISFAQRENKTMSLKTSGTVALHDLEIVDPANNAMLRLPNLNIVLAPSKPLEKDVRVEKIILSKPEIDIRRDSSGDINILSLGSRTDTDIDSEKTPSGPKKSDTSEPFRLVVDELKVDSAWVRFNDLYVGKMSGEKQAKPVEITMGPIQLRVQDFSTARNTKGRFDFKTRLNNKGDIDANGKIGVEPLSVETGFNFKDVVCTWIEPYLQGNVRLAITDGRFSSSGDLTLQQDKINGLTASIKGNASIEDVETVDTSYAEDLVSLKGLFLKKFDISYNPVQIKVEEILLKGLKSRLVLHKDGDMNLAKIFVSKNGPDTGSATDNKKVDSPAKGPVTPIKVDKISMQDIDLDFIDQQVEPNFSIDLKLSEVKITGLTSKEFKAADLAIKGKIDDYAPVDVTGKINPFQESLFADMTLKLIDMELSPLTPYSGKYIGNAIEKGKLSLDLKCLIEKKELKADEKIAFDQLTLGQSVESPDSLNLPVGLAISLLQDRNGQINLDVPVSGRLDDPEFKLSSVIFQALINITKKAASSPFTLIAAVTGGGEELRFIEFDTGDEEINDGGRKKLDSIITLLYERPGLNMGLTGYVDTIKDRAHLEDMIFLKKIKAQKRLELIRKGLSPKALEEIEVSPDEYEAYLKLAYAADMSSEPDEEMTLQKIENRIKENIIVKDPELKLLALNRAKQVKSYILKEKSIEPARLFLTEAATLSPEQENNYSASRVELILK